jgi:hypothetical protein
MWEKGEIFSISLSFSPLDISVVTQVRTYHIHTYFFVCLCLFVCEGGLCR